VSVTSGRENMYYSGDSPRANMPFLTQLFAEITQQPAFKPAEIEETVQALSAMVTEREQSVDADLMEPLHTAAYHDGALGNSLYPNQQLLGTVDANMLTAAMQDTYVPSRMVLVGVGANHDEFVSEADKQFGHLQDTKSDVTGGASTWVGGEIQAHDANYPFIHFAMAFETSSWHHKDLIPMCVLQVMMGGGGSFSAGGPGKGMYSRLYERVLNRNYWAESATCFNAIYTDSAAFVLHGTAEAVHGSQLVSTLCQQASEMAGPVTDIELTRAKNSLKSSMFMQLESQMFLTEDLARQLAIYGKLESPLHVADLIDNVTAADIQRVATDMLKTKPAVTASGNLSHMPVYEDIHKYFSGN
jgi:mitochondrial-processing peptidase subunit alpha